MDNVEKNTEKKPRKRKNSINKKTEKLIVEMTRNGQTMAYICRELQFSVSHEWDYRNRHPEYRMALQEALNRRVEMVEDALYTKAVAGDVNAAKFWLVNRTGGKWKSETYHKIGGDEDGSPMRITVNEVLVEIPKSAAMSAQLEEGPVEAEEEDDDV
jgi:hypothetical protein